MSSAAWITQILLFLGFTGFSFILLRVSFQFAAEGRMTLAVPPALAVFGVLSAVVFLRLKLAEFLVWHLLFLAMVFVAWRRKSRVDADRLAQLAEQAAQQSGARAAEISRAFVQARQLLTLGFACYVVAFVAAFFYLLPRP